MATTVRLCYGWTLDVVLTTYFNRSCGLLRLQESGQTVSSSRGYIRSSRRFTEEDRYFCKLSVIYFSVTPLVYKLLNLAVIWDISCSCFRISPLSAISSVLLLITRGEYHHILLLSFVLSFHLMMSDSESNPIFAYLWTGFYCPAQCLVCYMLIIRRFRSCWKIEVSSGSHSVESG